MKKIIVLGCGLVGRVIARDLAEDPDLSVAVADRSEAALAAADPRVKRIVTDLSDFSELRRLVSGQDLAIGALPGFLGATALRAVIEAGAGYSDISFMPEDPLALDALAKERGVTAVVDMGVSPGLGNLIVGRVAAKLDRTESVLIVCGGLPLARFWPFEYRAVFSPIDVIELYTRPARIVEHGRVVEKPAISDVEPMDFPGVGTLESFNTDGLRSLLTTVQANHMVEKTLRYPGQPEKMRMLREAGFFRTDSVDIGGHPIRPIDLTAKLLFPLWKMQAEDRDLMAMRIIVEGSEGGRRKRYVYDLLEYFDGERGESAMSRTTGFPCAIVARMIARGEISQRGVLPPETLGRDERLFERILSELARRGIHFKETVEVLD